MFLLIPVISGALLLVQSHQPLTTVSENTDSMISQSLTSTLTGEALIAETITPAQSLTPPHHILSDKLSVALTQLKDESTSLVVRFESTTAGDPETVKPYSFQTVMTDPSEPIMYMLNGQQITVDEFYAFQREMAKAQFLREEKVLARQLDHQAQVLAVLEQSGVSDEGAQSATPSDIQVSNQHQEVVATLTAKHIVQVADLLVESGVRMKLHDEPLSTSERVSFERAVPDAPNYGEFNAGPSRQIPPFLYLVIVLLGTYLLAFRSLRHIRG